MGQHRTCPLESDIIAKESLGNYVAVSHAAMMFSLGLWNEASLVTAKELVGSSVNTFECLLKAPLADLGIAIVNVHGFPNRWVLLYMHFLSAEEFVGPRGLGSNQKRKTRYLLALPDL